MYIVWVRGGCLMHTIIRSVTTGLSHLPWSWPQKKLKPYLNGLQRWSSNSQYPSRTVYLKSTISGTLGRSAKIKNSEFLQKTMATESLNPGWICPNFDWTYLRAPWTDFYDFFCKKSLRFFSLDCACFYSDWGTLKKPVDMPTKCSPNAPGRCSEVGYMKRKKELI